MKRVIFKEIKLVKSKLKIDLEVFVNVVRFEYKSLSFCFSKMIKAVTALYL